MSRGEKIRPSWPFYLSLKNLGFEKIIGVDEVGRGALAGPIVVAAVEINYLLPDITDSKLLTKKQRENLSDLIRENAVQIAIGEATNEEIDEIGLAKAQTLAYQRALDQIKADLVLTDFVHLENHRYLTSTKGDQLFYPVAAASIVAKVHRDRQMTDLHSQFPDYDWKNNVGYGTSKHLLTINKLGPSKWHRKTWLK